MAFKSRAPAVIQIRRQVAIEKRDRFPATRVEFSFGGAATTQRASHAGCAPLALICRARGGHALGDRKSNPGVSCLRDLELWSLPPAGAFATNRTRSKERPRRTFEIANKRLTEASNAASLAVRSIRPPISSKKLVLTRSILRRASGMPLLVLFFIMPPERSSLA